VKLSRVSKYCSKKNTSAEIATPSPGFLPQVNDLEQPYLSINAGHIQMFDEDLYRQLVCYPQEVIPTMDMAVNEMFFEKYPDTVLSHQVQVRPFNADKTRNMRALNPEGSNEKRF
jgi:DNA replication licensing factor MCM4